MNFLDQKLISQDSEYPINGTFLQKYQFVVSREISISEQEKRNLMDRASAEGSNRIKRYVQYIFSLYPYESN